MPLWKPPLMAPEMGMPSPMLTRETDWVMAAAVVNVLLVAEAVPLM